MEIEEKEKIVISKPVACRPRIPNLKSLSEFFSGAVNASSPSPPAFSETGVAVIRPKTVRFNPANNSDMLGADVRDSPKSNVTCNVVYKPIAKLVSKTSVTLLANLGAHVITPTQEVDEVGAHIQPPNQVDNQTDLTSQFLNPRSEQTANARLKNCEEDIKFLLPANTRDRPSYDGYNWRKYGQKQVKGSEYPRSYYKCTYPNCPVKKMVEKTLDGQIAEIVYKGQHSHSKPQSLNHTPFDGDAQKPAYGATQKEEINCLTSHQDEIVKDNEGRSENKNVNESSASVFYDAPPTHHPVASAACNGGPSTSYNSLGPGGECEEVSEFVEAEGDEFKNKRMKRDNQLLKASSVMEASSEPQIVVQNNAGSSTIGDGFRWRKYGQKAVKGKIYPRSYYRCTNPKCKVRKYVERTSEDPASFMTTYEGKHSHPMPERNTNADVSKIGPKSKSP